jgi:predicted nuclease with TOPRIM domain
MKRLTNAEKAEIHKELEEAEKAKFKPYENKIAELEKENAELKEEVKEWKDKADLWCKTANLKDHNIMINKELEKENAELKKANKKLFGRFYKKGVKDYCEIEKQLTKAKELLERLLITSCNSDVLNLLPNCSEVLRVRVEAEQFLSEVEK